MFEQRVFARRDMPEKAAKKSHTRPRPPAEEWAAWADWIAGKTFGGPVCARFCEWRPKLSGDSVNMVTMLCDTVLSLRLRVPVPIFALGVYALRNGLMDRICQCPGDPW